MKAMVSSPRNRRFEGWRESRESSCAALGAQCFSACFSERLFSDFLRIGGPLETLGGDFFVIFCILVQR